MVRLLVYGDERPTPTTEAASIPRKMTTGHPADPLTKQAIDWLIRLSEAPNDSELRTAADAWRRVNADRAVAWSRAEKAWQWLAEPAADPGEQPQPSPAAPGARIRRSAGARWLAGAAGAIAAGLLFLYAPAMLTGLRADFSTATAELRRIALEDGTVVELAPQTMLDVRFTASRRSVILLAGEAYFDVAANADRPFHVQAGELAVVVTGTAFDVRMGDDSLAVSVERGSVETQSSFLGSSSPVRLGRGDRLVVDRRSGAARRTTVPPEEVASWREHRMFVESATVAEVIDILRRYQPGWTVLADRDLGRQQVAGLYDLRDPDQALRILVGPFGGRVREVTPALRIVSGP
jgi:transmembrane sensor